MERLEFDYYIPRRIGSSATKRMLVLSDRETWRF
jgi:hypothetical protein